MRLSHLLWSSVFIGVSVAATTSSAASVAAELAAVPECALACVAVTAPMVGCGLLDTACQCQSSHMMKLTTNCMLANCTLSDMLTLVKFNSIECDLPHNSRETLVKALTLLSGIIAGVMIILRVSVRLWSVGRLWWDDWFHVASGVFTIPLTTFANLCAFHGFGKHLYDIDFAYAEDLLFWFYLCQGFWTIAIILIKFSILSLYIRIFPQKNFHRAVYAVMVASFIGWSIPSLMAFLQCIPVNSIWDLNIKEKKCLSIAGVAIASAGCNIATEIAILVLPIPMLVKLKLDGRKKLAVFALFGTGVLVISIASARVPYLRGFSRFEDPTWDNVPVLLWSCAESIVAHVCAAAPACRLLFSRVKATAKQTQYYKNSGYLNDGYKNSGSANGGILTTHETTVEKGSNVELSSMTNPLRGNPYSEQQSPPPAYSLSLTPKGQGFTTTTITAINGKPTTNPIINNTPHTRNFSNLSSSAGRNRSDSSTRPLRDRGSQEDCLNIVNNLSHNTTRVTSPTPSLSQQLYTPDRESPAFRLPASSSHHQNYFNLPRNIDEEEEGMDTIGIATTSPHAGIDSVTASPTNPSSLPPPVEENSFLDGRSSHSQGRRDGGRASWI